jgi:hypothetical protein
MNPLKVLLLALAAGALAEAAGEYTYDTVSVKRWILGGGGKSGNCEICDGNAEMGWIDMDAVFDGVSGDVDEPPAHPHCECEVEHKEKRVRVYA